MFSKARAALRTVAKRFIRADKGNVAMMFAMAAIPVTLAAGGGVDYARAIMVRSSMQDALDAAALAISKSANTYSQDDLNSAALTFFNINFSNSDAHDVTVTPKYTAKPTSVVVSGTAKVDMYFLGLIGIPQLTIKASASTTWGGTRLRVALVLDNTGSMADDGKMDALKTATNNLLGQLKGAVNVDGDVYVSIIPFSKDVNAGSDSYNESWIRWDLWDNVNGSCNKSSYTTKSTCEAAGSCSKSSYSSQSTCISNGSCSVSSFTTQSTCETGSCSISGYSTKTSCQAAGTCSISGYTSKTNCENAGTCSISGYSSKTNCQAAGVCSSSRYTTKSTCQNARQTWTTGVWSTGSWTAATWTAPGTWTNYTWTPYVWTAKAHSKWNGCITDRDQNYDTTNDAPSTGTTSTLFPAEQYSYCPSGMTGLTDNWTDLGDIVTNMTPNGNTNQAIGLQWGWQSLTQAPFTIPAYDSERTYRSVIILLTDGLNTEDRWYTKQTSIDAREKIACANVKKAGIILYTVQVNTGGDATSTMLRDCASNTTGTYDHFYLLTTADQIISTFDSIGTELSQLRLSN